MKKLLFDLFPIILFFVAFKVADIYVATGVAIVATLVQIAWLKLRGRGVEVMQWISLGVIVVFVRRPAVPPESKSTPAVTRPRQSGRLNVEPEAEP